MGKGIHVLAGRILCLQRLILLETEETVDERERRSGYSPTGKREDNEVNPERLPKGGKKARTAMTT
jgi:hypothetical protein